MRLWEERTFLEQGLLMLVLCLLLVVLGLSITVGVRNKNGWGPSTMDTNHGGSSQDTNQSQGCGRNPDIKQHCYSSQCISLASELLLSMDDDTDPCDDFYGYACNGWIESATLLNREWISPARQAAEKIILKLKEMLEEDYFEDSLPEHFLQARKYYTSCVNWMQREASGIQDYLDDVQYAGGFPLVNTANQWNASDFNYLSTLIRLWDRGYQARSLLDVLIGPDFRNTSKVIIALGAPDTSMYPQINPDLQDVDALYLEYLARFAGYLREEQQQANAALCNVSDDQIGEMEQVIEVQKRITRIFKVSDAKNFPRSFMKIGDLQAVIKEVDWLTLIRMQLRNFRSVDPEEEIMLDISLDVLKNLSLFLRELDSTDSGRRALANYLMWQSLMEAAPDLDQRVQTMFYDFQSEIEDQLQIPSSWEHCLEDTASRFRFSLTAAYVARHLPAFSLLTKPPIENLITQVRAKIKKLINDTFWMDDGVLKTAFNKVDKLYVTIGYPESFLSETKLNSYYKKLTVGDFHYENVKNSNLFMKQKSLERIGKVADRSDWNLLPRDMLLLSSPYYCATNNSAYVPLSLIGTPFFDQTYPQYANLARLGVSVAQVFARSIDVEGSLFDGLGNQKDWWKQTTRNKFANKTQCFVKLYDGYFVPEANCSLNGQKLLLQNVALNSALREAYKAFKQSYNADLAVYLPGTVLDPKQLFWLSYAAANCEKSTRKRLKTQVMFAVGTPARFRVNGPLSTNKDFVRDFSCPVGSKMLSGDLKCRVWGI